MTVPEKNRRYFWLLNLLVIFIVLIITARTFLIQSPVSEYRLQLSSVAHYVTPGFSLQPDLSQAIRIPPGDSPRGSALGGGSHPFLRPGELPYQEYTITARFDYTTQYAALSQNPHVVPSVMISRLGDSYEIYLNGHLLTSQWHLKEGGGVTVHKLARDIVLPININFLQSGENTILFRIYGDPTTVDTGLTIIEKYAIDDSQSFRVIDIPSVVFAGIYLAVALTFTVFFLLYREKKQNFWFSMTALTLALYTLFRANIFAHIIEEYELAARLEIFLLFSFAYLAIILLYSCGKERFNIVMKIFSMIYLAFCAALLLPGREFVVELIVLYYAFIGPALLYAFIASLCIPLYRQVKRAKAENGGETLFQALSGSLRGNMMVAAFMPIIISVADQITYMILPYQEVVLSQYGFLFFFANVTYALASDNAETHGKLMILSGELRTLIGERESQLRQKSGEVEEVKSAQTKFNEMITKEIHAPLGEIIGAIELRMLRAELNSDSVSWLRRILEAQRNLRERLAGFLGDQTQYEQNINPRFQFEYDQKRFTQLSTITNPGGTRHLFVINPKSFVTLRDLKEFLLSIEKCFSAGHRAEYKIYISRYPRDAYSAVHRYLAATPPEETARVYSVGGDGILFDCLNGLASFPNAELAPIPYGNSNDFVRAFGAENMALFRDIKLMSRSPAQLVDAILCGQQYALCSCSIGIEAKAVQVFSRAIERINSGKARTFVPLLYKLGGIKSLVDGSQINMHYTLSIDDEDCSGDYLMINIGNIALNGGSNAPNPLANPGDGFLDVILCKSSSAFNSLRMLSTYTSGQYVKFPDYLEHRRLKEIHCQSDQLMSVILDGETFFSHELDIKILPKAVHIVSPNGIGFADYALPVKGDAS